MGVSMGAVFSVVGVLLLTITSVYFAKNSAWRKKLLGMAHSGDGDILISVNYEVHGRVQGVFFRKHTNKKAQELKIAGWVMNTDHGTVKGNLQGSTSQVEEMKKWLTEVGSPKSKIKKCDF